MKMLYIKLIKKMKHFKIKKLNWNRANRAKILKEKKLLKKSRVFKNFLRNRLKKYRYKRVFRRIIWLNKIILIILEIIKRKIM